jgi:hypothetical protein
MATGKLIVRDYMDSVGQPLEGANVRITGASGSYDLVTDAAGQTEPMTLYAPEEPLSETPDPGAMPYSTYTVEVSKNGVNPMVITGVEVFPGVTSYQDVYLSTPDDSNAETKAINLPEWQVGMYPAKVPEAMEKSTTRVLSQVLVPEYVIVHDGMPSNPSAANYTVPFIDYIKNVASCEIYPTWRVEALRANIHAIISLTLSRVYTEWYRSKGYNFTITSTTERDINANTYLTQKTTIDNPNS